MANGIFREKGAEAETCLRGGNEMNFNHLEYAVKTAEYGSISKASGKLYLSQPYLSGVIKGLEEELGYKIFHRSKSGIEVTELGEEFIKSAKIILLELKKIKELNYADEKPLSISCYYATYIMEMFLKFKNSTKLKLPDKIREMGNREVLESILAGESTMGIVFFAQEKKGKYYKLAENMGLQMEGLFQPMPMFAMMSENHKLAKTEEIEIKELGGYPYVSYDDTSSKMFLKLLGIEENEQLLEVSDRGSFYDAVMSGEYLTIMAYKNIPKKSGVKLIPIRDKKLYLTSCYVISKNYQLTKREKEFLEFMTADRRETDGNL